MAKDTDRWVAANGKLDVSLQDQNGDMLNTYQILDQVADQWDNLTKTEQNAVASQVAGKNQYEVFASVIRNFATARKASEEAADAEGSANRENARYMDSIQGKIKGLQSAWSQFSNAMLKSDTVKNVLSGLTSVVSVLASDFGQLALKVGLFSGAIALLGKFTIFKSFATEATGAAKAMEMLAFTKGKIGGLVGALRNVLSTTKLITFEGMAGAATMTEMAGAAAVWMGGMVAAGAIIAGGLTLYGKYVEKNDKFIQQEKEAVKAAKEYEKAHQEVINTKQRVGQIQSEIDALEQKQAQSGLNIKEEERLSLLKQQYEVQKRQLELSQQSERDKFAESEQKLDKSNLTQREYTHFKGRASELGTQGMWKELGVNNKIDEALYLYNKNLKNTVELEHKATQAREAYDKALLDGNATQDDLNKLQRKANKAEKAYNDGLLDQQNTLTDLMDKKQKYLDVYGSEEKIPKELRPSYKALNKVIEDNVALQGVSTSSVKSSIKSIKKYGKAMGVTTKELEDGSEVINHIEFDKFSASLTNAGKSGDTVLTMLKEIGNANPEAKVTIGGTDYAIQDLQLVDGKLQTMDGKTVTTVADVEDNASPQLSTLKGVNDLGNATKNIDEKGYSDVQRKLANLRGNHNLGTDTKTIETRKVTVHETKYTGGGNRRGGKVNQAHGTRNFYAKGTGNAQVNEYGFEIIRDSKTGAMRIANGGYRGLTTINRGDAVYTHGQSMRMLQKAGLNTADILQGKTEDVFVNGLKKLKGFASGKSAQEKYNDARDKIRDKYDAAIEKLEYLQEKNHYSDKWLAQQEKKKYKHYTNEMKKLNKKYKNKKSVKKSKGLSTDQKRDYQLTWSDLRHDKAMNKLEDGTGAVEVGAKTYKELYKQAKKYLKKRKISMEEYKEILNDAANASLDANMKEFESGKKTYKQMLDMAKSYYKKKRITTEEYYEWIDEINEAQLDKEQRNYSNQWDYINAYVQRQIDIEEKNNEVIEAQTELLKAQSQKVRVYREGIGWVYSDNRDAIQDATSSLQEYSSVWEQIQDMMSEAESIIDLKQLEKLSGTNLVKAVSSAKSNINSWKDIIALVGGNLGAVDLASELGITDPSKVKTTNTVNNHTIKIDNVDLPSVTNANDFIKQLANLANKTIQTSTGR